MRLIQTTMTGIQQSVLPTSVGPYNTSFSLIVFQNNGTHTMRLGDNTVSSTKGYLLAVGGSLQLTPAIMYTSSLVEYFVIGTAADVLDILLLD